MTPRFAGRLLLLLALAASPAAAAPDRPVSFLYDVLPTLTRAGCSQGTCHGNSEGRGGLRLSLRGEDPERDYQVLVRDGGGRRLHRARPERSLLLLKASAALPHGGGMRLPPSSPAYARVARWIAEGARADDAGSPRLVELEVVPRQAILRPPREAHALKAVARFSDGSRRDVTALAVLDCAEPAVEIDSSGRARFHRPADAVVLARYAGQMAFSRLTLVAGPHRAASPAPLAFNEVDPPQFRRLSLLGLQPAALASDSEFIRRVTLDLVGRLPTADEARAFLERPRGSGGEAGLARERAAEVDRLLTLPEFDDFWTLKLADILRLEERSLDARGARAYRDWIRSAIAGRMPLDRMAYLLLTGSGSTYANPPANYYRRTRNPQDLAETTAQVFLGTRLLCARCHNHPTERWTQHDYYAFAAYFARIERKGEFTRKDQFDKHELIGEETIGVAKDGEVRHPRTDAVVPPGLPAFLGGPVPESPGPDRRETLARWITAKENLLFDRAAVNRVWHHLFGRGLVDPVDDLRESNPPANPELLELLVARFRRDGRDLRSLVRLLATSRTYQLSAEPAEGGTEEERFFSRAIPRRLDAEVLLDALSDVTGSPETFPWAPEGTRAVQLLPPPIRQRHAFLRTFGQPARESACECERTAEPTLNNAFTLIAGETVQRKLVAPENRISRLLSAGRTDAEIVREFYLCTLSRFPTSAEAAEAESYLRRSLDRRLACEDLLWALINTKEFLLRR